MPTNEPLLKFEWVVRPAAVIPANAGIHCLHTSGRLSNKLSFYLWIPALAGMTWMSVLDTSPTPTTHSNFNRTTNEDTSS